MKKGLIVLIICAVTLWLGILTYRLNNIDKKSTNEIAEYTISGFSTDLTNVIDSNKSSVVTVKTTNNISTGFIYKKIDNKLYIVTTLHSVDKDQEIEIGLNSGLKILGNVKAYDVYLDLALIECTFNNDVVPVTLGDNTLLKDGVYVVSIGTCLKEEYDFSSQFGMVSSKYREMENLVTYNEKTYNYYCGYIQLSGEFLDGYSGSPVFNMNGEVVGMIDQKDKDVTLAITINEIKTVVEKMINNKEYHRFNYGITGKYVEELENYEKSHLNIGLETINGYYIENVKPASFASNIGLMKGDVVVDINGIEIKNQNNMLDATYSDFENYSITFIRNNEKQKIEGIIND